MRELFIYFRASAHEDDQVRQAISHMQEQLRKSWPGLSTRCLNRPNPQDDLRTWMEVYAMKQEEGVSPAVQAAIESAAQALSPWIVGTRHVEVFVEA
ncbi:MAG: DUF4936 family protein [Burkholderiales bacterium]